MTWDVCDKCWGSGDCDRHGFDLREMERTWDHSVAVAAGEILSRSVGSYLTITKPAILALADELTRLAKGRKQRPDFFYNLAESLAKSLRSMATDTAQ